MPDEFLKINCRIKQVNTPLECRAPLGGPSLVTLYNHDFSVSPYVDVRYCRKCRALICVTIKNLQEIPVMETVAASSVEFKPLEEVFGFVEVHR
jgi:hypothetical protein